MYREQAKKNLTSILTNRPKAVKTLEDTYGVKFQSTQKKLGYKPQLKNGSGPKVAFKDRGDMECTEPFNAYRQNYNKYLITSSDRYAQALPTARRRGVAFDQNSNSATFLEERHDHEVLAKEEQYFVKADKTSSMRSMTPKQSKTFRNTHGGGTDRVSSFISNNTENSKLHANDFFGDDDLMKRKSNGNHYQNIESCSNEPVNDEKDDTEEFIALIRHEIEKSVVKSITEKMKNTFAELNKKIDRQASEINKIATIIQKLHISFSKKIAHYGEENLRHFRYLCMKAEYDKMFYQHHNQITANSEATTPPGSNVNCPGIISDRHLETKTINCDSPQSNIMISQQPQMRKPIIDNMQEVVGQLKKLCHQYETVIVNHDVNTRSAPIDILQIDHHKHTFPDEAMNFSSDGMTPRSMENDLLSVKQINNKVSGATLNSFNKSVLGGGDV